MIDKDDDVEHFTCPHLRFFYSPDADGLFIFHGAWEHGSIEQDIATAMEATERDVEAAFTMAATRAIDEVVMHTWDVFR